ncbi:MAG: AraC family transcriptional regulator [Thermodesulfobacteriota bacterium]
MTQGTSEILLSPQNEEELKTQFGTLFAPIPRDVGEASLVADGPLLRGRMELYPVRSGLRLFAVDIEVKQDAELAIEPVNAGVLVSLVLDGRSGCTVGSASNPGDPWEFVAGRNVVGVFQPGTWHWKVSARDSYRLVELHITPGRASQLVSEYREATDGILHPILSQPTTAHRMMQEHLTPELGVIASQVLNCRLQGPARRLFMESKALEILALQLGALSSTNRRDPALRTPDDVHRLEHARRIIEQEFADPPSLLALARRVGLNEFKLKSGFRELYRTTVFGYVRMLRMDQARVMLETGELNVGEVASAMGYTCFGHFSEAFRKRFGIPPREVKKRRKS